RKSSCGPFPGFGREDEVANRSDLLFAHQPRRVSHPGEFHEFDARTTHLHPPDGRFEQEIRLRSPQHQPRAFNLVPGRPQVDAKEKIVAEYNAGITAPAHAVDYRRVESKRIGAILSASGVVLGEATPLPVAERS